MNSPMFAIKDNSARSPRTKPGKPRRIDVHHHVASPGWIDAMQARGKLRGPWLKWSAAKAVENMEHDGVAAAVVSITTPGVWFGDVASARKLARECNEYAARLAADHPGRFGSFATLPMPDIEGSLAEIEYVLDVLKAEGICMFTSYGAHTDHGDRWLGDAVFMPVLEELNRRKAVVYVHPTSPCCCSQCLPYLLSSIIEYGTDTTRAIASLVFTGASRRFRNIRFIFSHAGGTMPFLIERFFQQKRSQDLAPGQLTKQLTKSELSRLDPLHEVRRFYYDTAQATHVAPMSALTKVVPVSQIVFGTDFPYRTIAEHVEGLKKSGVFSRSDLRAIDRENALRLLPRFGA
jgi:6-methylsalicylate decarboxylase